MRLTAVDVESRRLKRALRGYCIRDVDDFRQEIIDNFEEMLVEIAQLREQLEKCQVELAHYRSIEHNLNQSLLLAQRAGDDVRLSAHHEAEGIIRGAREEANEMLRQARRERADVERSIGDLVAQRDRFVEEFRTLLQTYAHRFEAVDAPRVVAPSVPWPPDAQGVSSPTPMGPPPAAYASAEQPAYGYAEGYSEEDYGPPTVEYPEPEHEDPSATPADRGNVITPPEWLVASSDE